jgi:uncharacterized DUF497 family protein
MIVTFDKAKSERNRELRGLPFFLAENFEFETAILRLDNRQSYPEPRYQALGLLDEMVCFLVFTPTPEGFRVISLRKASRKERHAWLTRQNLT